jgi:hypothetical protein
MRRNLMLALAAAILGATFYYCTTAWATAASGFTAVTLAKGILGQFEVFNHFVLPKLSDDDRNVWVSFEKTRGDSDLYIQIHTKQHLGRASGRPSDPEHRLAFAPRPQLDHRHIRNINRL